MLSLSAAQAQIPSCGPNQVLTGYNVGAVAAVATTGTISATANALGTPDGAFATVNANASITIDLGTTVTAGNSLRISYNSQSATAPAQVLVASVASGPYTNIAQVPASTTLTMTSVVLPADTRYVQLATTTNLYRLDAVTYSVYQCVTNQTPTCASGQNLVTYQSASLSVISTVGNATTPQNAAGYPDGSTAALNAPSSFVADLGSMVAAGNTVSVSYSGNPANYPLQLFVSTSPAGPFTYLGDLPVTATPTDIFTASVRLPVGAQYVRLLNVAGNGPYYVDAITTPLYACTTPPSTTCPAGQQTGSYAAGATAVISTTGTVTNPGSATGAPNGSSASISTNSGITVDLGTLLAAGNTLAVSAMGAAGAYMQVLVATNAGGPFTNIGQVQGTGSSQLSNFTLPVSARYVQFQTGAISYTLDAVTYSVYTCVVSPATACPTGQQLVSYEAGSQGVTSQTGTVTNAASLTGSSDSQVGTLAINAGVTLDLGSVVTGGNTLSIRYSASNTVAALQVLVATTAGGPFTNIGQVSGNTGGLGTTTIPLPIDARYVQLQAYGSAYDVDAVTHTISSCVNNPVTCTTGQQLASYQSGATSASSVSGSITSIASLTGTPDGARTTFNPSSIATVDLGSVLPAGTSITVDYYSNVVTAPIQILVASAAGGPFINIAQAPGSTTRTTYSVTLPFAARYVQLQTTTAFYYVDAVTYATYTCVVPPSTTCATGQQSVSYNQGATSASAVTGSVTSPGSATGAPDATVASLAAGATIGIDMGSVRPAGGFINITYGSSGAGTDPAQVFVAASAAGPYTNIGSLVALGAALTTQQFTLPVGAQFVQILASSAFQIDAVTYPTYVCVPTATTTCPAGQVPVPYATGAQSVGATTGTVTTPAALTGTSDAVTANLAANSSVILNLATAQPAGTPLTFTYQPGNAVAPAQVLVATSAAGPYTNIGQLTGTTSATTASFILPVGAQYVQLATAATAFQIDAVTYPTYTCVTLPTFNCPTGQQAVVYPTGAQSVGASTGSVTTPANLTGTVDGNSATVGANSSLVVNLGSVIPAGTTLYLDYNSVSNVLAPLQVLIATAAGGPYTNVAQVPGTTSGATFGLRLPVATQYLLLQTNATGYQLDAITYETYTCVTSPLISCSAGQMSVSYQQGAASIGSQTGTVTTPANSTGAADGAVTFFGANSSAVFDMGSSLPAGTVVTVTYYSQFAIANSAAPLQVLVSNSAGGPFLNIGLLLANTTLGDHQVTLPITARYIRLATGTTNANYYIDAVTYPIYNCVNNPTANCAAGQQAVLSYQGATAVSSTTGTVTNSGNATGTADGSGASVAANSALTLDLGAVAAAGNSLNVTYSSSNATNPIIVLIATNPAGPFTNIGQLAGNTSFVTNTLLLPLDARYVRLQTGATAYTVDAIARTVYTCVTSNNTSGFVYLDANLDGEKQTTEDGLGGITVNAYDASNNLVASTITSYSNTALNIPGGYYNFTTLALGQPYRLEFVHPNLSQYIETTAGSDSPTTVQFVQGQTQNHNLGLYTPSMICSYSPNPRIIFACGIYAGAATTAPSVVSYEYYDRGPGIVNSYTASTHTDDILARQVGIPIGLAPQRGTSLIFMSPFSTDYTTAFPQAPDGSSAIYVADYSGPGQTYASYKLLTKLSDLGINVGSINTTLGISTFGVQGLGGVDLSEDGRTLYVVNMYNGKLVQVDVSGVNYNTLPGSAPTSAIELTPPSSLLPCTGGVWRPTALKQFGGKIYMGGVCDAENSKINSDLQGLVLAYDPATSSWSQALSYPITFEAGGIFNVDYTQVNWATTGINSGSPVVEPVILDLAFDDDGAMAIGTTDRLLYGTTTSGTQSGYLLGAYPNGNGTWSLESGGVLGPYSTQAPNHVLLISSGPGGKYFFAQLANTSHLYAFNGGLTVRAGTDEVLAGFTDPSAAFSIGAAYINDKTGVIEYSNTLASGPKESRLTGNSQICDAIPPLEIGNRVWKDSNNNGIQDPGEPSLAGVTLQLLNSQGTVIATAITDANGNYIFSSLSLPTTSSRQYGLPLTQYTNYTVKITALGSDPSTLGLMITSVSPAPGETSGTTNTGTTLPNNDAFLVGGLPTVTLRTGVNGQINHTYDFGFLGQPCNLTVTASVVGSSTVTSETPVTLTTSVSPVGSYTYAWSGPASVLITPTNAGTVTASGLPSGVNTFTVTVTSSPSCFTTATVSVTVMLPPPSLTANALCAEPGSYSVTGSLSQTGVTATASSGTVTVAGTTITVRGLAIGTPLNLTLTGPTGVTAMTTVQSATGCQAICSLTATASVGGSTIVCLNNPVTLTAQVSPADSYAYVWSAPTGVTLTGGTSATATATGLVAGLNTFTVTVSSSPTCQTAVTVSVSVVAPPTITLTSATICAGQSVSLTASGAGAGSTYVFSTTGAVGTILNVNPILTTVYTVTATTSGGCSATTTATVTVNTKPNAGADQILVCGPLGVTPTTTTLTATPAGGTWSNRIGNPTMASFTPNAAVTVVGSLTTGTYNFIYTALNGCTDTVSVTVPLCQTFCSSFSATASTGSSTVTTGSLVTLTPTVSPVGSYTYAWSGPAGVTLTPTNASAVTTSGLPAGVNTFTVTVTSSPGCFTTAMVSVSALTPMLALSVTPGVCQSATNQYSVSGMISLSAGVTSTLTVTDGTASMTVAISAGQTSASFALSNLTSGTGSHTVTVSGTGYIPVSTTYSAPLSCTVTVALTVTPGVCQSTTNQYSISGTLSLTNALAGTAFISDGTSTTMVSVSAGATLVPYALAGLSSGTNSHTVTVSYVGKTGSVTYTAPASCTLGVAFVITPGVCQSATNQYTLTGTLSLTNAQAGTATFTDGDITSSVSVSAGQASVNFSLTALTSGTNSHTVTATFNSQSQSLTYTAPASCTIGVALTVTPGICSSATNQYSIAGTLSLTNAIAGSATITDGAVTTTVPVSAGATSVPYSLTGLLSGTGLHTVTVSYASKTNNVTYTAPLSCTVAPVLAVIVTPGTCNTATNQYAVSGSISLTAAPAGSLTITDGSNTITVSVTANQPSATFNLAGLSSGTGDHTVTVSGTGYTPASATYTAPASCTVAPPCLLAVVVTPTLCNTATNQYLVTGSVSATNAIGSQTVTLSDGLTSTTVTLTGNGPTSFTLTGLTSDGALHTVTASAISCGLASTTYTAPVSCTIGVALTVTPGVCQSATNQYSIAGTLSLTNAIAGTATITDGALTTTVSVSAGATSVPYSLTGLASGTGLHTVTVSYASKTNNVTYTAPLSCTVAPCGVAMIVTPGLCLSATNAYVLSGTITATNVPTSGTLIISSGAFSPRSLTLPAAANVSGTFSYSGLVSNGQTYTITASYSNSACSPVSQTFTAPASCSVAPVCSLSATATASICATATNTYSATVTVNLANAPAGTLTISVPGSTPISQVLAANTGLFTAVLQNLPSDGASHTATISLPGCGTTTATFTAPLSCSVAPICSVNAVVTIGLCETATNTFTNVVVINITNPTPGVLTVSDGPASLTFATNTGTSTSFTATFAGITSNGSSHTITASLPGCATTTATYTAPTSCSVAPICSLTATATAGLCATATNTYSSTVVVQLTNPTAGVLTVTDGAQSATLTVTASGSATFTVEFPGLVSDGSTHTVTASLPGCSTTTTTYTAPVSCSIAPICSVSAVVSVGLCATATNAYSITAVITVKNPASGTLTVSTGTQTLTFSTTANSQNTFTTTFNGLVSDGASHTVTASLPGCSTTTVGYTAPASCTIAPVCSISAVATKGQCSTATNTFSNTVAITLTNPMAGTLTVTDGVRSVTIAVPATLGTVTTQAIFNGIPSDATSHTVVASLPGCSTTIITYTAPASCTIALASLGDFVFADNNKNGIQDGGDAPIPGVIVTLVSNGTVVATTTTDVSGLYSFTGLTPGVPYSVSFTTPVNYTATTPLSGTDTTRDSNPINGITASVTLAPGENNPTLDAGFYRLTAGLGDYVFEDKNHNGQQDAGDTPIPGVNVSLLSSGTLVASTTSNASGLYSFTGLTPGVPYSVSFTAPAGYTATLQNVGSDVTDSDGDPATGLTGVYSLTANEFNPTVDMGYYKPASLGDFVFADNNHNGVQDAGDIPIPGVVVTLVSNGTVVSTTTTIASGLYSFTGLTPGVPYSVSFTTPSGYTATTPLSGTDTTKDSNPINGITASVTLASGENNPTIDAGFVLTTVNFSLAVIDPGSCQPVTNQYTTSGVISLTGAPAGTALVTDGPVTTTLTIGAGQTTATYSLSGLISGTGTHTMVVSLAGQIASTTYLAPAACSAVSANLSLQKSVSLSKANLGDILTYTVVVTNAGSTSATTTVRDSLSTGATFVVGSSSIPVGTSFTAGRPVSLWKVPALAAGQSLSMTYQVRIDSTGIIYNVASIPGDTAKVCTTVSVTMCPGDIYTLTAPTGRSSYSWYRDGVLIPGQTTNVITISQPGSYSLGIGNGGIPCLDFSCCPFILEIDSLPTFQAQAVAGTCLGNAPQANGQIILSNFRVGQTYQYSAGATFDPAASLSGLPTVIPTNGVLVTSLANPKAAQFYTVRVYNGSGCYTDQTIMLLPTICGCPADVCVPFVIQQTKRPRRIGDPIH